MGSITEGFQHIGDSVLKAKIAKYTEAKDRAKEQAEASSVNAATLELVSQTSPNELDSTSKVLDAIGNKSSEASKLVYNSIQQKIKDRTDFDQTLKLEKYKAGTAAVTEVIKNMADKGGFSPEQLQNIQMESADRVYKSLGVTDISQAIKQNAQAQTVDSMGNPIDMSRPKIQNEDGSFSTEKTATFGVDGKFINIPTIVNGKQLTPEKALEAYKLGVNDPVGEFKTEEEATKAAVQRSKDIGQKRGGESSSFFTQPIPPKKTEKQLDQDKAMQRGSELIDMMHENYKGISKKYGTGRLKGIATSLRGAAGDLLPKDLQAPEVKPYIGNLDGIAQFVGRNVYNDDRVSNEDRKAYRKSLAELTASPEEEEIFYQTLKRFTKGGSVKDQEALKLMFDKTGGGMLPSKALAAVGGDFTSLSLDEKKALLKKKLGQ